ncbi:hypothetical protein ACFVYT_29790 [Streptomyces sp. NPDC058290]|uniref:hypothetical protein n=1 Tax=Streptomyces sp. NPDC058290 TaxID=3346426 RepID=UPI0036E800B4
MDARTLDGRTRGHAVVQHVFIGKGTIRVEFDVDCLTTDGGAVTVTGPVATATATPVGGEPPTTGPAGWHKPARAAKCTPVPAGLWVIGSRTTVRK